MEKIIIFGVGSELEKMISRNYFIGYEIVAFCDNDCKKWGQIYEDKTIISPNKINEYTFDKIMITTKLYADEIREQLLRQYGIVEGKIETISVASDKYDGEMAYWRRKYRDEGMMFANEHYERRMLSIAQEIDDSFLENKVIADFGCGPRGSLKWAKSPLMKIGIDVLASRYMEEFGETLIQHDMTYVTSTEKYIPLPNESVDCICTINSLDHVNNLAEMSKEILRILKPSGILLASFNLNEPATECEPQTLTEKNLEECLLKYFEIESYRLAHRGKESIYEKLEKGELISSIEDGEEALLWVRGKKK